MKKLILFLSIILLCGCSPQKRIARIAEKYNLKKTETVMFRDTIIVEPRTYIFQTEIDSTGHFEQEHNGVHLFGSVKGDSVKLRVITDFDTIYIEKPVEVEKISIQTVEKKKVDIMQWVSLILFFGVAGFVLFKVWRKKE